jgi:hypothetical protein
MNFFDLDPRQLPTSTVYRIQYDGCMTIPDPLSGFAEERGRVGRRGMEAVVFTHNESVNLSLHLLEV